MRCKLELSLQWFPGAFPRLLHPPERKGGAGTLREPDAALAKSSGVLRARGCPRGEGCRSARAANCPLRYTLHTLGSLQIPWHDTSLIRATASQALRREPPPALLLRKRRVVLLKNAFIPTSNNPSLILLHQGKHPGAGCRRGAAPAGCPLPVVPGALGMDGTWLGPFQHALSFPSSAKRLGEIPQQAGTTTHQPWGWSP